MGAPSARGPGAGRGAAKGRDGGGGNSGGGNSGGGNRPPPGAAVGRATVAEDWETRLVFITEALRVLGEAANHQPPWIEKANLELEQAKEELETADKKERERGVSRLMRLSIAVDRKLSEAAR